ncbi:MAG: phage major capsid protein [Bacteroidota bacterium]
MTEAEKKAQEINEKIDAFKTQLDSMVKTEGLAEAIKEALGGQDLSGISDELKAIKDLNDEISLEINKLKKAGEKAQGETLEGIIKENFDKIVEASTKDQVKHEFEVSEKVLTTAVTSTITARDNSLSPLAFRTLKMADLWRHITLGKDNAGTVSYIDWDTATTTRAAAMVAEGGTFPSSDAAWEEFSIKLKKIGDSMPVSEEFTVDQARFNGELAAFLGDNVAIVEDTQLLSGNGTGSNLTGVLTSAPVHGVVSRGIVDASVYDLIPILREGIVKGKGSKYRPNFVMMNLTEINNYKLKKDGNNNYVMPPFVSADGNVIDGIPVIENNGMADNTMLMGDSRYGRIYDAAEGYTVQVGYVDSQFKQDLKTLKARKRLALLIKNSEKEAYIQVTSITTALTNLAL